MNWMIAAELALANLLLAGVFTVFLSERISSRAYRKQQSKDSDDQLRYADVMARQLLVVAAGHNKQKRQHDHGDAGPVSNGNGHVSSSLGVK